MSAPANVTCSANMRGDVVSAALAVLFVTVRTVRLEWIATETAVGLCRHCSMRTLSFPSDSMQLVEREHPFSVNKCDSHYLIFCSIDVSGHPANYHKFTLNWLLNCALLMRSIFGEVWVVKPSSVWQVAAMFSSCFLINYHFSHLHKCSWIISALQSLHPALFSSLCCKGTKYWSALPRQISHCSIYRSIEVGFVNNRFLPAKSSKFAILLP